MYQTKIEEDYITRNLLSVKEKLPFEIAGITYHQISLFDDYHMEDAELQNKIILGECS